MGCSYTRVPAPRGLVLERQLASSAVFTWQPPATDALRAGAHELLAYHVYVNGHFRLAVNASATPARAFIDRIDFSKVSPLRRSQSLELLSSLISHHQSNALPSIQVLQILFLLKCDVHGALDSAIGPRSRQMSRPWPPATAQVDILSCLKLD